MHVYTRLLHGLVSPSAQMIHVRSIQSASVQEIRVALESVGLRVFELDGCEIRDKEALLSAMSRAIECPEYFGRNWDALEECMSDLAWLPAPGYAILYSEPVYLLESAGETFAEFLRIVIAVAAQWLREGVPFHLLLVDVDDASVLALQVDKKIAEHMRAHK